MLTHELIGRLSIMYVYTACTMHEGHLYIHELIEGCMYIQQVPPPIDTYSTPMQPILLISLPQSCMQFPTFVYT